MATDRAGRPVGDLHLLTAPQRAAADRAVVHAGIRRPRAPSGARDPAIWRPRTGSPSGSRAARIGAGSGSIFQTESDICQRFFPQAVWPRPKSPFIGKRHRQPSSASTTSQEHSPPSRLGEARFGARMTSTAARKTAGWSGHSASAISGKRRRAGRRRRRSPARDPRSAGSRIVPERRSTIHTPHWRSLQTVGHRQVGERRGLADLREADERGVADEGQPAREPGQFGDDLDRPAAGRRRTARPSRTPAATAAPDASAASGASTARRSPSRSRPRRSAPRRRPCARASRRPVGGAQGGDVGHPVVADRQAVEVAAVLGRQRGDERRRPARDEAVGGVERGQAGERGGHQPQLTSGEGQVVDGDVTGDVAVAREVAGVVGARPASSVAAAAGMSRRSQTSVRVPSAIRPGATAMPIGLS